MLDGCYNILHMKKAAIIIAVVLIVGGSAAFVIHNHNDKPDLGAASQPASGSTASSSQKQLFKGSQYEQYAYLISGDSLDSSAQQAITGFKLNKRSNPDGTVTITLKALEPAYNDQTYTLKPGQKLYFIETSLSDDQDNRELSMSDDTAIIVDSQGYIVP